MNFFDRSDPGECIVCGAAHCACGGGLIEIQQTPMRDAAAVRELQAQQLEAIAMAKNLAVRVRDVGAVAGGGRRRIAPKKIRGG